MATLGGIDLGQIQSEKQTKDSGLFNQPIPASDSDQTLLLDIFGVTRAITIEGIFQGTQAAIRTFIGNIESIESGTQTGSAFVSGIITSPPNRNVFVQNFEWTYAAGDAERLLYTLVLIEGLDIS